MPDRILRAGIIDSHAVNSLSEAAEIFYRRLFSVVDDFGRYEADPELLRVKCFWRQVDRWPAERIKAALLETGAAVKDNGKPLIISYEAGGKRYLEVTDFGRPRAKHSKYPHPPTSDNTCEQMNADVSRCLPEPPANTNTNTNTNTSAWDSESAFRQLWDAYPSKGRVKITLAQQYYIEEIRNAETHAVALESVTAGKWAKSEKWAKGFVLAFPEWLHNRAWETEDPPPAEAQAAPSVTSTMDPETRRRLDERRRNG
jgi:hypothetical protein